MWVFFSPHIAVYHMHAMPESARRRTEITDCCELPHGCQESNPGLLNEQPVTISPAPTYLIPITPGGNLMLAPQMRNYGKQL